MKGVEFKAQNATLGKPQSMTDEECYSLPIRRANWNQYQSVESVWELTDDEIKHIKKSKRIVLSVLGITHPPLHIGAVVKGGIYDAPETRLAGEPEPDLSPTYGT